MGYRIVVDTCVARSAGRTVIEDPVSKVCRNTLLTLEKSKFAYQIVMTQCLLEEWERNASVFALWWLTQMRSKKRVVNLGNVEIDHLRERVDKAIGLLPERRDARDRIFEDIHLIEAALMSDKRIISRDENARCHFYYVITFGPSTIDLSDIGEILWVNPEKAEEDVIGWLESGAPEEETRCLRNSACPV